MPRKAGDSREPWIMVKVGLRRSPKLAELPNASARLGWVYALLEAKVQREMGVFASRRHLREMVGGAEGRHVDDWIEVGLAHEVPAKGKPWPDNCTERRCASYYHDARPGQVVIHDFRREQRDPTNADRQAAHRARNAERNGDVTDVVTETVTPTSRALSPSLSLSPTNEGEPYPVSGPVEPYRTLEELSHFAVQRVSDRTIQKLDGLCDRRTVPVVVSALRSVAPSIDPQPPSPDQLVYEAIKHLEPFSNGRKPATAAKGSVSDEEANRAFRPA